MRVLGSCLFFVVSACAALGPSTHVDMDAVVIALKPGPDLPTDVYDAETVLHYAREAERAGDFAKGERLYRRLLKEFPGSRLTRSASFGAARCVQGQVGCATALPLYAAIKNEKPEAGDVGDWVDVHFREGACLLELKRAKEAADSLSHLLAYPGLSHADKLEGMIGRGIAFEELGELDLAERDFVLVFAYDREHQEREPGQESLTRFSVARAGYHLGEVNRMHFEQVKLEYPDTVLEARLEEKSQLLLRAQTYYLRAIRLGSLEVAAASGFRVGAMYERFHGEIVGLKAPDTLNKGQVDLYQKELRTKIGVLLRKAVKIYEEAVAMAQRTGLRSTWVEKMTEALARIKKLFLLDLST